jgi:hypothetical protein
MIAGSGLRVVVRGPGAAAVWSFRDMNTVVVKRMALLDRLAWPLRKMRPMR